MLKRLISIRAPPFLSMFKCSKTGGYLMRDYTKNTFWTKQDPVTNQRQYYINLNGIMVEVTKEVYYAMFNSYRKSLHQKELTMISLDSAYNGRSLHECFSVPSDPIQEIYKAFLKEIIWAKIKCLDETEKAIIVGIFYENKTEAEVGSCLGMSQQLIHYKKVKIIEKLKKDLTLILKEELDN